MCQPLRYIGQFCKGVNTASGHEIVQLDELLDGPTLDLVTFEVMMGTVSKIVRELFIRSFSSKFGLETFEEWMGAVLKNVHELFIRSIFGPTTRCSLIFEMKIKMESTQPTIKINDNMPSLCNAIFFGKQVFLATGVDFRSKDRWGLFFCIYYYRGIVLKFIIILNFILPSEVLKFILIRWFSFSAGVIRDFPPETVTQECCGLFDRNFETSQQN